MPEVNWEEVASWANQIKTSLNSLVWTLAKSKNIDPDEAREEIVEKAKTWQAPKLELAAVVAILSLSHISLTADCEPWAQKLKELSLAGQAKLCSWGIRRE